MSATEAPRRLRTGDVIANLEATVERLTTRRETSIPSAPSVELSRNAKGDTQIAVKASGETVLEAEASAVASYDRLCALYPHGAA